MSTCRIGSVAVMPSSLAFAPFCRAGGRVSRYQGSMAAGDTTIKAGSRNVEVSNLDKVFYPDAGFTKGDVIDYYRAVAPALLPHLKGRPITLKRYPNGVEDPFFYEKECPSHRPKWVKTAAITRRQDGKAVNYCVLNDEASLVWAANLADLELHTSLAVGRNVERPQVMVFDLDPGAPAGLVECCEVALVLRAMLVFEHDETLARIEEHGDLFEPVLTMQQRLPKI